MARQCGPVVGAWALESECVGSRAHAPGALPGADWLRDLGQVVSLFCGSVSPPVQKDKNSIHLSGFQ